MMTETDAYLLPVDVKVEHLYSTAISLTNELPTLLSRLRATARLTGGCQSINANMRSSE